MFPTASHTVVQKKTVAWCLSCKEQYIVEYGGTCKECYQEAKESQEDLRRQIDDLNEKASFLALPPPVLNVTATDVILIPTDDSTALPIPAHKYILVSRSPVLKAMLEIDMTESRSGTIKICDVSYDTLHAFVNYLYTGEADLDHQMACNLLVLGEKYEVIHLKTYCEKFLITKINLDKSVENYVFAYQYNCKQLLSVALKLILENMDSFSKNQYYSQLVNSHPRLVVEIYETYMVKQLNTAGTINVLGTRLRLGSPR